MDLRTIYKICTQIYIHMFPFAYPHSHNINSFLSDFSMNDRIVFVSRHLFSFLLRPNNQGKYSEMSALASAFVCVYSRFSSDFFFLLLVYTFHLCCSVRARITCLSFYVHTLLYNVIIILSGILARAL